nr:MAG TPA: DNA repair photolyase [Caudoviricetes sp.]
MKPIYIPKGAAKEYGDYAINIYTGCPHRCYYCFAPSVLRRDREAFHTAVRPRENIVEETQKQIEREGITGSTIHLCFTCDPYPKGYDTTPTREIIKILKESGNHVQILTKNGKDAMRDFDLLDSGDWFGITYAGYEDCEFEEAVKAEPNAGTPHERLSALFTAYEKGIKTWISAEPVLNSADVLNLIDLADYVNLWKVGKLNYHPSGIDWKKFGERAERYLKAKKRNRLDFDYYIKNSLRAKMEE